MFGGLAIYKSLIIVLQVLEKVMDKITEARRGEGGPPAA